MQFFLASSSFWSSSGGLTELRGTKHLRGIERKGAFGGDGARARAREENRRELDAASSMVQEGHGEEGLDHIDEAIASQPRKDGNGCG